MKFRALLAVMVVVLMVLPGTVLATPGDRRAIGPDPADFDPPAVMKTLPLHYKFSQPVAFSTLGHGGAISLEQPGAQMLVYPGLPRVPVVTKTIELPGNLIVERVTATHGMENTVYLNTELETSPPLELLTKDGPVPLPITQFYSGGRFPADWFTYDLHRGLNAFGEDTVYVQLYMYPTAYQSHDDSGPRITYIDSMDVSVQYTTLSQPLSAPRAESYMCVVIGPSEFRTDLETLTAHKTMTGLKSKFVTLDDINNGAYFTIEGRDDAEKIKYFIKNAVESWGIKYVILGGDVNKVATRELMIYDGTDDDGTQYLDGKWVPSDIYFADIYDSSKQFSSWDENSNGVFGEWTGSQYGGLTDDPDLYEDVYVGRLPAGSAFQISQIVQKIRSYENSTDWSWFFNAGLAGVDTWKYDGSGIAESEYGLDSTGNILSPKGFALHKLYSTQGTLSPSTINSHVNAGVGVMILSGHGGFDVWGDESTLFYRNSDMGGLSNGAMLPVGWQSACDTGGFDNENTAYYPYPWVGPDEDAMSEAWVQRGNAGDISDVGSARLALGLTGSWWPQGMVGYLEKVTFQALADGYLTPAKMLAKGRKDYMGAFGINFVGDYKHMVEFNQMGDPSAAIGGIGAQVTNVSVDGFIPPGGSVDLVYNVKNTGAWATTFNMIPVSDGPFQLTPSPLNLYLSPGEEKQVTVTVTADLAAVANTEWPITLTAKSGLNDRATGSSIKLKVGQIFDMDLTVDADVRSALPGDDISFVLTANNLGNGPDGASISYSDVPSGWAAQLTYAHVDMPVHQGGSTTLNLGLPDQVLAGSYWFNVTAIDDGKPEIVKIRTLRVDVQAKYEVDITCNPCAASTDPGATVNLPMTLFNKGNVPATITVNGTAPEYWAMGPDLTGYPVGPYNQTGMTLSIKPPEKTLAGDYTLYPRANIDQVSKEAAVVISINRLHGIKASVEVTEQLVDGGQDAFFAASVLNLGNGDEEIVVENVSAPPGWMAQGDVQEFIIQGYQTYNLDLVVTTIKTALAGKYTVTMKVRAKNVEGISDTITLTVEIQERPDASASLKYPSLSVLPGKSASNTVEIENRGNVHEVMTLGFGSGQALVLKALDSGLKVDSLTQAETGFTITAASDALAGPHDYSVMVKRDKGPTIYLNGTITVLQVFKIGVQAVPSSNVVDAGKSITKTVRITNQGNGQDTVTLKLTGNQSYWASMSPTSVVLGPGESKDVTITISPPIKAAADTHQLTLKGTSTSGVSGTAKVTYIIKLKAPTKTAATSTFMIPWLLIALAVGFVVGKAVLSRRKPQY